MPRPDEHLSAVRPLAAGEAERVAERMAAFATGSRVKLLYALLAGDGQVDELAQRTGMTPNAVSQQLRVLRHLQMVAATREGRGMHYRLHDEHIADLLTCRSPPARARRPGVDRRHRRAALDDPRRCLSTPPTITPTPPATVTA